MTTIEAVREYLLENGNLGAVDDLTDDVPLIEREVLDSLGLLAFVEYLEVTYDVEIDDALLVRDNFETVAQVARFVDRLRAGAP
ncbi:MAG: acyl carrier protein [Acidimicrobiales bacterium]|jgi:acyl carrier protein|nr:acyl carrier protein [Acidimicrobiales bacterium]